MEIGQVPVHKRWSNSYGHTFKMKVTEAFQSGQMSQRQVTRKLGVHRTTIVVWEKRYGNIKNYYLKMEEKSPHQELAELRAGQGSANWRRRSSAITESLSANRRKP